MSDREVDKVLKKLSEQRFMCALWMTMPEKLDD